MVLFWVLDIVRLLVFRGPESGPKISQQPHRIVRKGYPDRLQHKPEQARALIRHSQTSPSTPQLPFKTPQIPSNRDHKALNRRTLGGLGHQTRSMVYKDVTRPPQPKIPEFRGDLGEHRKWRLGRMAEMRKNMILLPRSQSAPLGLPGRNPRPYFQNMVETCIARHSCTHTMEVSSLEGVEAFARQSLFSEFAKLASLLRVKPFAKRVVDSLRPAKKTSRSKRLLNTTGLGWVKCF